MMASQSANVTRFEAITEGEDIHPINRGGQEPQLPQRPLFGQKLQPRDPPDSLMTLLQMRRSQLKTALWP